MGVHQFSLKDRKDVAEGTMAFWFDTEGFSFTAGQYAVFTLNNPPETDEKGNTRTFSIASSPHIKNSIMIATRIRGSAFKNSLKKISIGTKVESIGPIGSFVLHKDNSIPAVFLAGGIGITPFRSIIEWATFTRLKHKIYLFYSNRNQQSAAFLDELSSWSKSNPFFKFIPTMTEQEWNGETGRISPEMIKKHVQEIDESIFYLAGPGLMVSAMRKILEELAISEDRIRSEEFAGY